MTGTRNCPDCGSEIAPGLLTCPGCRRLVYAARLKQLAAEAATAPDPTSALVAWRSALELLPPDSRQHAEVSTRIAALGREVDALPLAATTATTATSSSPATTGGRPGLTGAGAAGIGTLALFAWKFKALLLIALTKGKLLLLGLGKASTFSSMLLSLGVYWTAFGWKFALGLVLSIYIHEMGHVFALMRYGVKASAPLFLPGLGAVIRLRQALGDPRQDARVGLAGPLWGLGTAAAAWGAGVLGGWPLMLAIAKFGAWINLFNLLPLGSLDGGRAFHALSRPQRWAAAAGLGLLFLAAADPSSQALLAVIGVVALLSALSPSARREADTGALVAYLGIAAALTLIAAIDVPRGAGP